jgi:OmpA-OmpF porin, OOP family
MRIVATAAIALIMGNAPAFAKDGQPYLEVDMGAMLLEDVGFDTVTVRSLLRTDVQNDMGYDAAAIVGYDLGPVRLELEGSAKRAGIDALFRTKTNRATNASVTRNLDGSGNTAALSLMILARMAVCKLLPVAVLAMPGST